MMRLEGYHLQGIWIQPIEALASILEIEAFLKYVLLFEPGQGIPHGSGRQIGLGHYIFLGQEAA